MKILWFIVLLALFQETRHQFPLLYPSYLLPLANEEFIEETPPIIENVQVSLDSNKLPDQLNPKEREPGAVTQDGESRQEDRVSEQAPRENGADVQLTSSPIINLQKVVGESEGNDVEGGTGGDEANNESVTTHSHDQQRTPGPLKLDSPIKTDAEEPIPSYMEWAQKKQQEMIASRSGNTNNGNSGVSGGGNGHGSGNHGQGPGQTSQNGARNASSSSMIDAKNFASPDCGAKVVQSNAESQNAGGVLSSSHDEYMLNKCGTNIWFVVELCEPLTVERISLGNLELFSSSPKEIEFGISDKYPTRDWSKQGPFVLPDARAVHQIVLPPSNTSVFGKFVKVSVLSHYGNEHYCPISVIRVNGKSEYEVLESETTHDEENKEGGALYEEPVEHVQENVESVGTGRVVGGIKDTVLSYLNKAVQTIVSRGSSSAAQTADGDSLLKSKCRSVLQCVPRSSMTQEIYKLLSCNSADLLPFMAANSPWCGWDYCHATFETKSIGLPWQPEGFFASIFGGPASLHALCHYMQPQTEGCDPACLSLNGTFNLDSLEYSNESVTGTNITIHSSTLTSDEGAQIPNHPLDSPNNGTGMGDSEANVPSGNEFPAEQQLEAPDVTVTERPTDSSSASSPNNDTAQQQPQQAPLETQIPPPTPISSDESVAQMNQFQPPQQKESVFVRLTNRIKNLERNQSLTASYLEELSKRFKKQNEDSAAVVESNKKTLNETRLKLLILDEFHRHEIQSARRNLEDLRERLFTIQLQRSLLVVICISQTVLIVCTVLWIRKKFRGFQQQMDFASHMSSLRLRDDATSSTDQRRGSDPLREAKDLKKAVIIRKRSNSDTIGLEKIKRIKKKNKKHIGTENEGRQLNSVPHMNETNWQAKSTIPKSHSGDGFFDVPPTTTTTTTVLGPKENIDPKLSNDGISRTISLTNQRSNSPNILVSNARRAIPPSTFFPRAENVDFFSAGQPSEEISTSSRFALLASPVRESGSPMSVRGNFLASSKSSTLDAVSSRCNRSGSTESTSSTASGSSFGGHTHGKFGFMNGSSRHFSSSIPETASIGGAGEGKKGKKGLKSLMPKFFDR